MYSQTRTYLGKRSRGHYDHILMPSNRDTKQKWKISVQISGTSRYDADLFEGHCCAKSWLCDSNLLLFLFWPGLLVYSHITSSNKEFLQTYTDVHVHTEIFLVIFKRFDVCYDFQVRQLHFGFDKLPSTKGRNLFKLIQRSLYDYLSIGPVLLWHAIQKRRQCGATTESEAISHT